LVEAARIGAGHITVFLTHEELPLALHARVEFEEVELADNLKRPSILFTVLLGGRI
jgi:hypothetical protein